MKVLILLRSLLMVVFGLHVIVIGSGVLFPGSEHLFGKFADIQTEVAHCRPPKKAAQPAAITL
jgi:hypothetical protein